MTVTFPNFGAYVVYMRRLCDISLIDMAEDFAARPAQLQEMEKISTYTDRQKALFREYFRIVCAEKGLRFIEEKPVAAYTAEKPRREKKEDVPGFFDQIFKGIS